MPHLKRLTPNLLVANVERSLAFYTEILGFERGMTVPEQSPFVFAQVTSGSIEIFLNDAAGAVKEYPVLAGKPLGTSGTMFVEVEGIRALHAELAPKVTIVMPLITQWYGTMEFVIADPDGYLITFAERVP
jgi:catechol 2,3-dioxygenase-like lactoylglutathione lyase family enzyme